MNRQLLCVASFAALSVSHAVAQAPSDGTVTADRRVALVIGNSTYVVGRLQNPVQDARAMAKSLRHLGFEAAAAIVAPDPAVPVAYRTLPVTAVRTSENLTARIDCALTPDPLTRTIQRAEGSDTAGLMRLARCPRLLLGAGVSAVGIILILTIRLRPRRHESLRYWDD